MKIIEPATKLPNDPKPRRRKWLKLSLAIASGSAISYGILAYLILPALWRHYERNPSLATSPKVTRTGEGIPGDPVNIGLVGTQSEVLRAMLLAGWQPADPITVKTSFGIAKSVLLKSPYPTAPVSNLYYYGRKQDLAFEQPVGSSANKRHHVRFWRSPAPDPSTGRTLWIGSATFDRKSGFSHLTGKITHHIAADIDAERDSTIASLERLHQVTGTYQVAGVDPTLRAYNGGGDPYYTDGEITIAVLSTNNTQIAQAPTEASNPPAIQAKHYFWQWLRAAGARLGLGEDR